MLENIYRTFAATSFIILLFLYLKHRHNFLSKANVRLESSKFPFSQRQKFRVLKRQINPKHDKEREASFEYNGFGYIYIYTYISCDDSTKQRLDDDANDDDLNDHNARAFYDDVPPRGRKKRSATTTTNVGWDEVDER